MAAPSLRDVAWWFSTLSVRCRVRAVPCIHRSRAVVDTRVRWRRCGHPVLPLRQPRSSGRSPAQVSWSHPPAPVCRARQAAASLAPLYLRPIARLRWMHGTARCRELCDYGDFYAVFKSAVRALLTLKSQTACLFCRTCLATIS